MSGSEVCEEHRCVIIIKVPHFSETVPYQFSREQQVSCHHDGFLNEHYSVKVSSQFRRPVNAALLSQQQVSDRRDKFVDKHYSVNVYANGTEKVENDEDYVSVRFTTSKFGFKNFSKHYEFSFVAGVLDASGWKRFPKSYVFDCHPHWHTRTEDLYGSFILSRVVKSDALRNEPDDLLTDDCLTLHIDVIFRSWSFEPTTELEVFVKDSFEYQSDGKNVTMNLDSKLGKHLVEESHYFRSMSETPIFSLIEYFVFRQVCYILEGVESIRVPSANDLRMIYAAADKYDIPTVMESCRGLLSTLLRAAENDPVIVEHISYDVPLLLDLADTCNDVRLKKIVESFIQRTSGGGIKDSKTPDSTPDPLDTEWRLEKYPVGVRYGYFVFARGTPEEGNFDFYQ